MRKKVLVPAVFLVLAVSALTFVQLHTPLQANALGFETKCRGIVDKKPGEAFEVKVTFKNKGSTEGSWMVAAAFEGEDWTWGGDSKQLTFEPCGSETLTWQGEVAEDARIGSTARLIIYFNDEFEALNWWIHIIPDAELSIIYSEVS